MNIQDEMNRIFKVQQDNLVNERKFKEFADGERKSLEDEEIKFMWLNYYECPECENVWEDEWDCQVDDDCPDCGCRHISPYKSQEVAK
mgnify:FL=1